MAMNAIFARSWRERGIQKEGILCSLSSHFRGGLLLLLVVKAKVGLQMLSQRDLLLNQGQEHADAAKGHRYLPDALDALGIDIDDLVAGGAGKGVDDGGGSVRVGLAVAEQLAGGRVLD